MKTIDKVKAFGLTRFYQEMAAANGLDFRAQNTMWEVMYEVSEVGYCIDLFLTDNRRTPPTFADLPDAGPHDGSPNRPPLTIESIKEIGQPSEATSGATYCQEVIDLRRDTTDPVPDGFTLSAEEDGTWNVEYAVPTDGGQVVVLGFPTLGQAHAGAWVAYYSEKAAGAL